MLSISKFPSELLAHIFHHLQSVDIGNIYRWMLVCKTWQKVIESEIPQWSDYTANFTDTLAFPTYSFFKPKRLCLNKNTRPISISPESIWNFRQQLNGNAFQGLHILVLKGIPSIYVDHLPCLPNLWKLEALDCETHTVPPRLVAGEEIRFENRIKSYVNPDMEIFPNRGEEEEVSSEGYKPKKVALIGYSSSAVRFILQRSSFIDEIEELRLEMRGSFMEFRLFAELLRLTRLRLLSISRVQNSDVECLISWAAARGGSLDLEFDENGIRTSQVEKLKSAGCRVHVIGTF